MIWHPIPCLMPDMQMWVSVRGEHQYVVGFDHLHKHWSASAKTLFGPNDRPRADLGFRFATREEAEAACERHAKSKLQ